MSRKAKEITTENFSAAVDYAYKLNKRMRANVLAQKILLPLGSIVFALYALILSLGAIYASLQNDATRVIAFNDLKFITGFWDGICGMCQRISDLVYVQVILIVLSAIIVPFVISSIAAIIIFCTTKEKQPSFVGNTPKQAKQLYSYLDKAPRTYFEAFDGPPVYWRRATGIVSGIIIILFMFYFYGAIKTNSSDFLPALSAFFKTPSSNDIMVSIIFGGLFYVVYVILHYIFTLMIQPYCDSYGKWIKSLDAAERYWLSVDENEREERARKKLREEEEKKKRASSGSSSSSSSPGLSYAFKFDYINRNFGGIYSFGAIEYIRNDSSLTPAEKEEMIIFLRAFGD